MTKIGRPLGISTVPRAVARVENCSPTATAVRSTGMRKINSNDITEDSWSSPKGIFAGAAKGISEALGREPFSTDLKLRHPFDVELTRVPAGQKPYPYHSHSAQWEFYYVLLGRGKIRHQDGSDDIRTGDAFLFGPDEPHQLVN